jgi:uncharacterized protein (TIGR00369 family)
LAAPNPAFETVIRSSFAAQGLLSLLGADLVRVEAGHIEVALPFSDRITQQQGFFHGAAVATIADVAGGYAALSLMPAGSEVVTVEYKINFVKPAIGERLTAVGDVIRAGRSITVCRVDVFANSKGAQSLCAILQASFARVELPASGLGA